METETRGWPLRCPVWILRNVVRRPMIPARHCVAPALEALLQNQPLSPGKAVLAWSAAVGPTLDRVTSVMLASDGTLAVRAASRNWAHEIHRSGSLIMSRMNRLLGAGVVTRIEVTTPPAH